MTLNYYLPVSGIKYRAVQFVALGKLQLTEDIMNKLPSEGSLFAAYF